MFIPNDDNASLRKDQKSLMEIINVRLGDLPGLSIILNVYSKKKYGKDFVKLVLEDLKSAYNVLVDVLKSNESAEIVFTYILKALTLDDTLISNIISDIKKGKKPDISGLLRSS